jgi:hypothetical protein
MLYKSNSMLSTHLYVGPQERCNDTREDSKGSSLFTPCYEMRTFPGALQMLAQYTKLFRSYQTSFSGVPLDGLKFHDQDLDDPDSPPMLDSEASTSFLLHQQTIEKIMELVDAVESQGNEQIQEVRHILALEIQSHQAYLDRLVQREQLYYQLKHVQIPPELEGRILFVVQPGNARLIVHLFFLTTS